MSLSSRNYSKESSSYYSRSASYHSSSNNNSNVLARSRTLTDYRPLSTRLIERDISPPALTWDWDFDDPFQFDRLRWRFGNDFWKFRWGFGRAIPITHRSWNISARVIPIQYSPSLKRSNTNESSTNYIQHHDESSMSTENHFLFLNKIDHIVFF